MSQNKSSESLVSIAIEIGHFINDSLSILLFFQLPLLSNNHISRMSDDQALKMYETRAELDEIREEMIQIRSQNNEMRSRLVVNDLIQNGETF